jgi:hypothetical protein
MSIQNLDQLAWDYLMSSPRDQAALGSMLVSAGAAAVFPLLRAALQTAREFSPLRTQGVAHPDREAAESVWIYQIAEPMLKSIYTIMNAIGQPAYDALCRALWESDFRMRVWAGLVLFQDKHPNSRTTHALKDAFDHIGRDEGLSKANIESGLMIMLSVLMARGGDSRVQSTVTDFIRQNAANERDFDAITENTAFKYLLRLKA